MNATVDRTESTEFNEDVTIVSKIENSGTVKKVLLKTAKAKAKAFFQMKVTEIFFRKKMKNSSFHLFLPYLSKAFRDASPPLAVTPRHRARTLQEQC
jgi:hypothetical protein